ncbi:hypothetical protein Tco_1060286 [Tanacetum coccineum]
MEDVLPWPGNANMAFDLRPVEDVLPWPGNANMVFDLRRTEDVLPWPGNANMTFDLRPAEDVLPWPGNANMAFDLRPAEDVLPWPERISAALVIETCRVDKGSAAHDVFLYEALLLEGRTYKAWIRIVDSKRISFAYGLAGVLRGPNVV